MNTAAPAIPSLAATVTANSKGLLTTLAAIIGLMLGPSVIAVLTFGIFIRPIEAEFGWTRVEVSLASSIIAYMIMFVSPLQGLLVDRFGPRRVILCSIPAFAAGLAAFSLLPASLPLYYFFWGLMPVLAIGLWPLAYLQAVSFWFDRKLGLALGIANGGIGLGTMVVPVLASAMIASIGWRETFVGLGALVLLVTWPAAFFLLKEARADRSPSAAIPVLAGMSFKEAFRTAEFKLLAVVFLLFGLGLTGMVTQQVPMLIDAGWTPQRAALVQATFGMALFAARIGVGYLIDYLFAPFVMLAIALGGAVACVLYATVPEAAFVSAALLGLVVGAEFDVLAFLIKRYFGTLAFGRIYGTMFAIFQLASGLSVAAVAFGRQSYGSYVPVLFMLAALLTLSAILLGRLGPYRHVPERGRA